MYCIFVFLRFIIFLYIFEIYYIFVHIFEMYCIFVYFRCIVYLYFWDLLYFCIFLRCIIFFVYLGCIVYLYFLDVFYICIFEMYCIFGAVWKCSLTVLSLSTGGFHLSPNCPTQNFHQSHQISAISSGATISPNLININMFSTFLEIFYLTF